MRKLPEHGRRFRLLAGAAFVALVVFGGAERAAAEAIFRTLTVAWDASPSAEVAGYRLHYGTHSGNYSHLLDVGNRTSADVPNLIDGTTYFFNVTAYDSTGAESAPSDEFTHTAGEALFLNISTRALVRDGDDVMIAGFVIGGSSRKRVVVRALGPSLSGRGVGKPLANPAIELHGVSGVLAENDNWRDGAGALLSMGMAPQDEAEAGLVVTLPPGTYTAIVRGKFGATGTALLEVYDAGVPPAE